MRSRLIELLRQSPDLNTLFCVDCGERVEEHYHEYKQYHPYGSTVAAEYLTDVETFCKKCKLKDNAAPLIEELAALLDGKFDLINRGHGIKLIEFITELGDD